MSPFECIAEQREREALQAGEFDRLPGAGKPLRLDDDSGVPAELRAAYRVLRNAGLVPEGVSLRRDIHGLEAAIADMSRGAQRSQAQRRLVVLRTRLERCGGPVRVCGYEDALLAKLGG